MRKRAVIWLMAGGLLLSAAVPRLYELGHPGFYGDEETTALPAYAVATGGSPEMPTGMPYRRALPLTYLNAATAQLLRLDAELSYRLPSALLGTLTVLVLFLLARPFVGTSVAFIAALLLALSEWHVATSREARMYAPFLLFYITAAFANWQWINRGGNARMLIAGGLIISAVSFHQLGIVAVMFPVIGILFGERMRVPIWHIIAFTAVVAVFAWSYNTSIVAAPQHIWTATHIAATGLNNVNIASTEDGLTTWLSALDQWYLTTVVLIGIALGLWAAWLTRAGEEVMDHRLLQVARYCLAGLAGALIATAQVHGAALVGMLFLLIYPVSVLDFLRSARHPLWLLGGLMLASATFVLYNHGLIHGIKQLLGIPFPYSWSLLQMLQGIFLLFLVMITYLALKDFRNKESTLRILAVAALLPILAIGIMSKWGGMRYIIEVYPFVLLLAAAGLITGLQWIGQRSGRWGPRGALLGATVLTVSGALGGHGIPQALRTATVDHGDTLNKLVFGFPTYPDHQAPGHFVAERLRDSDIVVAEDTIQQKWYVGRVDYWLRRPVASFLFQGTDGQLRDIYTGSISLGQEELAFLEAEAKRRIWLITSGETFHARDYYLTQTQHAWLKQVEASTPTSFAGRDGITRVYCINCPPAP